jgi:hypothetical protein
MLMEGGGYREREKCVSRPPPLMTWCAFTCSFALFWWHGLALYVKRAHPQKSPTPACSYLAQQTCRRSRGRSVRLAATPPLRMSSRTSQPVDLWQRHSTRACKPVRILYWQRNHAWNTPTTTSSRRLCLANACFGSSYVKLPESTAVRTNRGLWLIEVNTCMLETWKSIVSFFILMCIVSPGCTCNASVCSART